MARCHQKANSAMLEKVDEAMVRPWEDDWSEGYLQVVWTLNCLAYLGQE